MALKKELRAEIHNFLLRNPIDNNSKDKYGSTAEYFNVDREQIRGVWRTVKISTIPNLFKKYPVTEKEAFKASNSYSEDVSNGKSEVTVITKRRIKTLQDLIEVCEIDLKIWEIERWECNKWEVGRAADEGGIHVEPLFQVKAKLIRRKVETDLALQKDVILKELYATAPKLDLLNKYSAFKNSLSVNSKERNKNCLLELCLFDPHFGKLAHEEESGKDEDIKIVSQKYTEAIKDLISRVNIDHVERILLPIGNDMINIDGSNGLTTAGTPQTSDSRFYKIVRTVKELLIKTITDLLAIAPVDVVVVKGNHDSETMFMIGEILEAYFHNTKSVTINNAPTYRKYYQYGNTGLQFTHGNEEPHQALGLIFATEKPELWADVKFRYCQVGHFHKNKKTNYVSVDEHQGFQIQILPSLSHNDSWHSKKGYQSMRQAKAFLIDINDGIVGEFTHTSYL